MKKEIKKELSISKLAWQRVKKTFTRKMSVISIFVCIFIATLMLGFFLPGSLFLTVPFLLIPFFFCLLAINTVFETNVKQDETGFFMLFKAYYSPQFYGCFKILKAFLLALLGSYVCLTVGEFVGINYLTSHDPEFVKTLESLIFSNESIMDAAERASEALLANPGFLEVMEISGYVGGGVALAIFLHVISYEGVKYYFNLLCKVPILARDLNLISSRTIRGCKKEYKKDYFKSFWFVSLLTLVGYALGALLGIALNLNSNQVFVVGLFGAFIFVLPFIPYYLDATMILFKKYHKSYADTFLKLSIESLEELKKQQKISPEKEKEIKDFLNGQKEDHDNEKSHD